MPLDTPGPVQADGAVVLQAVATQTLGGIQLVVGVAFTVLELGTRTPHAPPRLLCGQPADTL